MGWAGMGTWSRVQPVARKGKFVRGRSRRVGVNQKAAGLGWPTPPSPSAPTSLCHIIRQWGAGEGCYPRWGCMRGPHWDMGWWLGSAGLGQGLARVGHSSRVFGTPLIMVPWAGALGSRPPLRLSMFLSITEGKVKKGFLCSHLRKKVLMFVSILIACRSSFYSLGLALEEHYVYGRKFHCYQPQPSSCLLMP